MTTINIQDKINTPHKSVSIEELYTSLSTGDKKSCYEYFNTYSIPFVKPFLDIDIVRHNKKDFKYSDEEIVDKTITKMKEIFGDDINVIYTIDNRRFKKPTEKNYKNKMSYHFIIDNKKIDPILLGEIVRKSKSLFTYLKDKELDTAVYRKGDNKFRLPLTIKEPELEKRSRKSYMTMSLEENVDNFKKYCLSITNGLEELEIKIDEVKEDKNDVKDEKKKNTEDINMWDICELDYKKYNSVLDKYEHKNVDKKDHTWICDLEDCDCPFGQEHENNHRYLTLNFLTNSIYIKCHSEKCKNKMKMIMDNVFSELKEFDLSTFKRLVSYNHQRRYLEKRIVFLSDVNVYKQIKIDKHNNKYLEEISVIPINSTKSVVADEDGEKISTFGALYNNDKFKKIYKNTNFYPNLEDSDKHYYNEYQGMGYERILEYHIDRLEVIERQKDNLKFYKKFLLKYVCGSDKKVLDYFLSLLSFYIKYPDLLNHIILVMYSNEQGTGKSSFLDFLSKIIGNNYCANVEIEQVLDKHSNLSYKKIINVIEELSYDKGKNYSKKLKNRCQAETTILNEKNLPMRTILNFVHYIITTNEYRSIPLEPNDRRHFILEFSKIYNNDDLVNKVDDLYFNKEFIYAFGNYLKNRVERFDFKRIINWEKKRPTTELFRIMIKRDSIETFFTKLVRYEYHNDNVIKSEDSYGYYVRRILADFSVVDGDILIKKCDMFDLYEERTDNEIKYKKDSFNREIMDIKKFMIIVNKDDEVYLKMDLVKIKHHLKLSDNEIKILDLLKLIADDKIPEKIRYEKVNKLLNEKKNDKDL